MAATHPSLSFSSILRDPRHYQITCQLLLMIYGFTALGFDLKLEVALLMVGLCLVFQFVFASFFKATLDPRSALISGLSLVLMLRTHDVGAAAAAALLVVAGKFLIRIKGKHVFNPSNLAIVVLLLASDKVWVSSGQWGSTTYTAFLTACLGGLVLFRARRSDITIAFLVFYAVFLTSRSLWLNEPMRIPLHRLESGSLLLFAFFMISDPKATPDSRAGRIIFALLTAMGTYAVQFYLFRPNGLLYSLAFLSPLIPLIDRLIPGGRYEWSLRGAELQSARHKLERQTSPAIAGKIAQATK